MKSKEVIRTRYPRKGSKDKTVRFYFPDGRRFYPKKKERANEQGA